MCVLPQLPCTPFCFPSHLTISTDKAFSLVLDSVRISRLVLDACKSQGQCLGPELSEPPRNSCFREPEFTGWVLSLSQGSGQKSMLISFFLWENKFGQHWKDLERVYCLSKWFLLALTFPSHFSFLPPLDSKCSKVTEIRQRVFPLVDPSHTPAWPIVLRGILLSHHTRQNPGNMAVSSSLVWSVPDKL